MITQEDLEQVSGGIEPEKVIYQVGDWVRLAKKRSKLPPSIDFRDHFRVKDIFNTDLLPMYTLDGYHFDGKNINVYDASYWKSDDLVKAEQPWWYKG